MLYGAPPVVAVEPQMIYGVPHAPPPIPLYTMEAVDDFLIGERAFDVMDVPTELTGPAMMTINPYGFWQGGLGATAQKKMPPPKFQPTLPVPQAAPVQQSTWAAVIGVSAVIIIGSVAIWAYSKYKKK